MRKAPAIKKSERPFDCCLLAQGFDTIVETASMFILNETWAVLDEAKKYSNDRNTGDNQAYPFVFCGMEFLMNPKGGANAAFIFSNPEFTITIAPASLDYNVKVTFSSAVLWQYGVTEARKWIWGALLKEMKPRILGDASGQKQEWRKLSRADWALDFHSPEFTGEIGAAMVERFCCHSSAKVNWRPKLHEECDIWGTSTKVQTITIGKKDRLQVTIYNKSDEITEKSQKTWFYKVWGDVYKKDVWRIELRFFRKLLADEGIDTFEQFEENQEYLLCEALGTRRLCDRTADTNKRRWPVHPMWYEAIEYSGNKSVMLPIGKTKVRASEVVAQEALRDAESAMMRFFVARGVKTYESGRAGEFLEEAMQDIFSEPARYMEKYEKYVAKYTFLDEAH